jgi:hypothetical protein
MALSRLRAPLALAALLAGASAAHAQAPRTGGPATSPAPRTATGVNPYLDPAMNPYLNPYLSTTSVPPDAALFYFLAAQRASGGIGSGALGGSLQAQQPRTRTATEAPRSRSQPAEGAERYFHRGPNPPGGHAASYFQRRGGRFDR